ncbi:MAG: hypothetical protein CL949_04480 [Erythrobacter sp.]|nr:hypothetical protein [Erythrobacter sp.]
MGLLLPMLPAASPPVTPKSGVRARLTPEREARRDTPGASWRGQPRSGNTGERMGLWDAAVSPQVSGTGDAKALGSKDDGDPQRRWPADRRSTSKCSVIS